MNPMSDHSSLNRLSGLCGPKLCALLLLAAAATLSGCTLAPEYSPPLTAAHTARSFENAPAGRRAEPQRVESHMARWWRHLEDPLLDRFVAELRRDNLDLKQAAARLEQAWEQRNMDLGSLFPSLSAAAAANRNFSPTEEFGNIFGGAAGPPGGGGVQRVYDTSIEANLRFSWQLDVFGRLRSRAAASEARAEAVRSEGDALLHTLVAQLARNRVAISALDRQLELTRKIVDTRERTLDIVQTRYEAGTADVSAADVHLARESLDSARADIPDLRQQLRSRAYAVDVLLGQPPGTTDPLQSPMPIARTPEEAPVGLPAGLLDRRPDLRGAELRVMAEYRDIGVAVADMYPDLTLSGRLGFEDDSFSTLFASERMVGSIVSEIMTRLFQGGRLRARVRLEKAQAEEMALEYAQSVLVAIREVEEALLHERQLDLRISELKSAAAAARRAQRLTLARYERGLATLLDVLQAQRRSYAAGIELIRARQARWNARVDLYLALGGDWLGGGGGGETKDEAA